MVRVYYGDHFEHPSTHEHLTTPETVAKFMNLFFSFILMVAGIGLAVLGIWLAATANEYNYFISTNGVTPTILLITYGIGVFFFSSVSCCATARHSGFLLGVVVVSIFLLVCGEIMGLTFAFSYRDTFKGEVKNQSLILIGNYSKPGWQENATDVFDKVQRDLDCCGVESGPNDWAQSVNGTTLATYWVSTLKHVNDTPDSCCLANMTGCGVGYAGSGNGTIVYNKGCVTALFDWFDDKMLMFVLAVSVVLLFQIINVCGMYLWRRCIVHGF